MPCRLALGVGGTAMDLFYLGLVVGFFGLSLAFVILCERV
jgi:hypothetical protein